VQRAHKLLLLFVVSPKMLGNWNSGVPMQKRMRGDGGGVRLARKERKVSGVCLLDVRRGELSSFLLKPGSERWRRKKGGDGNNDGCSGFVVGIIGVNSFVP